MNDGLGVGAQVQHLAGLIEGEADQCAFVAFARNLLRAGENDLGLRVDLDHRHAHIHWLLVFAVVIVLGIILAIGFAGTLAAALGAGASMDSNALAGLLGTAGFVFLCLLCLLIPLTLVLNLIYAFAYRGIMLRDMPVMDSIRHGWRVVREHVGEILLLGLIFFVVNLIIGAVATGIIGLLGISSGLFGLMMSGGEPTTTQIVAGIVGVLATFIIFAIISAIFTTWRSATFTLAYQQWTGKDTLKDSAAPMPPAGPIVS